MKKWIAILLAAVLMLSGCQIVIVNPFATAPSTEASAEAGIHTEPSTQPTDTAVPTGIGSVDTPGSGQVTTGYCVDCGTYIDDPAGFDPYHCVGCGDSGFFECTHCGKRIPGVASIRRMCIDCYWSSGSTNGHCVLCGGALDVQVAGGMICSGCYYKYGKNINLVMLLPQAKLCSVCRQVSACGAYLVNGEFACADCGGKPVPLGGGRCDTCGMFYAEGEGFESLCFDCQEKYGPKCSVCGTDCTYRGTIDGMCDECWEKSQLKICAQCGKECLGTWVGEYYVCDTCAQMRPCPLCGNYYYIWDMFEGVCFDCNDPSGGMADMEYCVGCGTTLYEGGNYDGYCYYCHPSFGFTCIQCGMEQPMHRPESGLCPSCEAGEVTCLACGATVSALEAMDGLCWDCYVNQLK